MHHTSQIIENRTHFSFFEHSALHFSSLASIFFNSNKLSLGLHFNLSSRKNRTNLFAVKIKKIICWSENGLFYKIFLIQIHLFFNVISELLYLIAASCIWTHPNSPLHFHNYQCYSQQSDHFCQLHKALHQSCHVNTGQG